MARIFKRNKIWYLDYYYKNNRYRKKVGRSKRVAEAALNDIEVRIDREDAGLVIKRNIPFNKLAREYLKYSNACKSTSSYNRDVLIIQKHALAHFGKDLLRNITTDKIEKYIIERASRVKESTVNRELNTIFNLFQKAVDWGLIQNSPCKGVKKLKEKSTTVPKFLLSEEITKLLSSCPRKIYLLVYLAIYTGCRQSELFNLEWSDVDFDRKQIVIQNKEGWHTKSYKHRIIPINDRIANMLLEQKEKTQSNYIVSQDSGEKLDKSKIRRTFEKAMREAGISITDFRILRHTYASHLVMQGIDIRTVQKLLGHHSIKMTEKYSHLAPDHLQSVANFLNFQNKLENKCHKNDTNQFFDNFEIPQVVGLQWRPQGDSNPCRRRERAVS